MKNTSLSQEKSNLANDYYFVCFLTSEEKWSQTIINRSCLQRERKKTNFCCKTYSSKLTYVLLT